MTSTTPAAAAVAALVVAVTVRVPAAQSPIRNVSTRHVTRTATARVVVSGSGWRGVVVPLWDCRCRRRDCGVGLTLWNTLSLAPFSVFITAIMIRSNTLMLGPVQITSAASFEVACRHRLVLLLLLRLLLLSVINPTAVAALLQCSSACRRRCVAVILQSLVVWFCYSLTPRLTSMGNGSPRPCVCSPSDGLLLACRYSICSATAITPSATCSHCQCSHCLVVAAQPDACSP